MYICIYIFITYSELIYDAIVTVYITYRAFCTCKCLYNLHYIL